MHLITWAAYAAFAATSVALLITVNSMWQMFQNPPDRSTRVRKLRRMGVVVGSWQISTGLCIIAMNTGAGWTGAIALFGMGGMFLSGSWLSRKLGVAPWWAPE